MHHRYFLSKNKKCIVLQDCIVYHLWGSGSVTNPVALWQAVFVSASCFVYAHLQCMSCGWRVCSGHPSQALSVCHGAWCPVQELGGGLHSVPLQGHWCSSASGHMARLPGLLADHFFGLWLHTQQPTSLEERERERGSLCSVWYQKRDSDSLKLQTLMGPSLSHNPILKQRNPEECHI